MLVRNLFLLIAFIHTAKASTLFMPDSDSAALISLVSNTASTVSNTIKILDVAKKTSDQIDKYNFLAMRRYFIARRIEQHGRDVVMISKMNPKELRELNQVMIALKMNLKGLRSSIDFMAMDLYEAENFTAKFHEKLANSIQDENEAYNQEIMSANEGSTSKHVQNTAMNTAMGTKVLTKIRRDNLEYQKNDIALKKGEVKEKLRKEVLYKEWLGIGDKGNQLSTGEQL